MFGIVVAFQDHKAASGFFSPWVGFQNFRLLVESPVLGRLVWNTLYLNTLFIVFGTFFAVLIALLLNEVRFLHFKNVAQSFIFLPFFMGWTLVAMILYGMIDPKIGTLNIWLNALGLNRSHLPTARSGGQAS